MSPYLRGLVYCVSCGHFYRDGRDFCAEGHPNRMTRKHPQDKDYLEEQGVIARN